MHREIDSSELVRFLPIFFVLLWFWIAFFSATSVGGRIKFINETTLREVVGNLTAESYTAGLFQALSRADDHLNRSSVGNDSLLDILAKGITKDNHTVVFQIVLQGPSVNISYHPMINLNYGGSYFNEDNSSMTLGYGPTYGPTSAIAYGPTIGNTYGSSFGPSIGNTFGPMFGPSIGPTIGPSYGQTFGATYGPSYGATYGSTYGPSYGATYGGTYGPSYGATYGGTYGPSYGGTYGPTYGPSYGATYGPTYGPSYGATYGSTYGPSYGASYTEGGAPVEPVTTDQKTPAIAAGRLVQIKKAIKNV